MAAAGLEKIEQMENSVQKTFWGIEAGEKDTIYLVTPFHQPFVVYKHKVGERMILCPGKDKCAACNQGERPIEFFCFTIWSERFGRVIASWQFSKQAVLKPLYKRFKRLNPDGTPPDAIKDMKGDAFLVERETAFKYAVEYVDNRLDQVEGMQQFTEAEIIAKMQPRND